MTATSQENLVLENLSQEGDICLYTTNTHFSQGTLCLANNTLKGGVVGGNLYQEAVVVGGDDSSAVDVSSVKADSVSTGTAVGGNLSGVGSKVIFRILGGNTTLKGKTTGGNI